MSPKDVVDDDDQSADVHHQSEKVETNKEHKEERRRIMTINDVADHFRDRKSFFQCILLCCCCCCKCRGELRRGNLGLLMFLLLLLEGDDAIGEIV